MFYVCFDQMQNNLVSQSAQMETGGTPNDMISAMNQVGCIIFTPLVQLVIYPFLHKRHIYVKPITRITIGFAFVVLSMTYAAIVQNAIYSTGPCYDHPRSCNSVAEREPNHINAWIQAPVFLLISVGEVFAYVTALEIACSHAPKHMKSMVQAIFPLMAGFGSAVAMGIGQIAHDPSLVIFYASLAGGMAIVTVVFWLLFRTYDKTTNKETTEHDAEADEQSQSAEDSEHGSFIKEMDLDRESEDVELGPMVLKHVNDSSVSHRHSDLTGTTLSSSIGENTRDIGAKLVGQVRILSAPETAKKEAVDQTTVPKPTPSWQMPSLSPRSPSKTMCKLQKR